MRKQKQKQKQIRKDEFMVTAGRDRTVRYWNLSGPNRSFRLSAPEQHINYKYQAYKDKKSNEVIFEELAEYRDNSDDSNNNSQNNDISEGGQGGGGVGSGGGGNNLTVEGNYDNKSRNSTMDETEEKFMDRMNSQNDSLLNEGNQSQSQRTSRSNNTNSRKGTFGDSFTNYDPHSQRLQSYKQGKDKSQHQDIITDLKAIQWPQNMLLTSDRNGIVKVWI